MRSRCILRVRRFVRWASICWVVGASLSMTHATCGNPGDPAAQILSATDVQGGLVVHVGCGDGKLTAALRINERFIVRGIDRDEQLVDLARRYIQSQGMYGPVSVERWVGKPLPYVDNLVNLLVIEDENTCSHEEMTRVLAPLGVAYIKRGSEWKTVRKPWPADIDEWTHYLHGPDNNAVARDRVVGPPTGLQWICEPIHLRSHEHLNSVSAVVSAKGRIFTIIDEGPTAAVTAPPQWRLVARDAFNGILLWKQELGPWEGHFRLFRSGPPDIARRLVAKDDTVYVTEGYGKPVLALDAATGKRIRSYAATDGALEILHCEQTLFVVTGEIDMSLPSDPALRYYPPAAPRRKGIVALDADSGRVLWSRKDKDTAELMPSTLAVSGGRAFFQNTQHVICLDASSGQEHWRADRPIYTKRLSWSTPTLVVHGDVVLSADGSTGGIKGDARRGEAQVEWQMSDTDIRRHPVGDLLAFSVNDGKRLWNGRSLQGFCNPGDLFVIGEQVYCGADVATRQTLLNASVDLKTGQILSHRPENGMPVGGHTRCYRSKATERFLLLGDVGVDFIDVRDWSWNANPWVRGTCQYGIMPCNGLIYVPPDSCACRPEMRLHGFSAMAARHETALEPFNSEGQIHRGPAFDGNLKSPSPVNQFADWPTYRGDNERSGYVRAAIPASLCQQWKTDIGGKLSALTVAAGKVFVARVDSHQVYALDEVSGQVLWSRTVGAAVDSPPTCYQGCVVFGCRDGCVYCLRCDDGELAWQFRAGPLDQSLVAMHGIESVWPIHGSTLIRDDQVWFAAGRSPFLDGGIRLWAIDFASGNVAVQQTVLSRPPQQFHSQRPQSDNNVSPPGLPDILSADQDLVYMRWMGFDNDGRPQPVKPHLFSATGFLDDSWWHRTYWQYGSWMRGGFGGWPVAANQAPAGRVMVADADTLYAFGRSKYDAGNGGNVHAGHVGMVKQDYQDSGRVDLIQNAYRLYATNKPARVATQKRRQPDPLKWQTPAPVLVRAMILANRTLFIAGPEADETNRELAEIGSPRPGSLWAVSATDGALLNQYPLATTPVFDGLAAAGNRIFLSQTDGSVLCLGPQVATVTPPEPNVR